MHLPKLWPSLLLAIPVSAQGTIISPAQFTAAGGNSGAGFPFLTSAPVFSRYMQVHSDLGTTSQVFKQLAFRFRGPVAATVTASATIDMEMSMSTSVDFDKVSWVFANNATGGAITVIPRQVLNLGPIAGTASTVEPFLLKFPFTALYPYSGTSSVLWETKIYSNSVTVVGTPAPILDLGNTGTSLTLAPSPTGAGCTVAGQSAAMKLSYQHYTPAAYYTFSAWVELAPAIASTVLAVGTSNPATVVPGLCGGIYTNLLAVLPMGVTNASGFLGQTQTNGASVSKAGGGAFGFVVPNTWAGNVNLYFQAHSLDASSSNSIPIASSGGLLAAAVGAKAGAPVRVTRLYSADGGTTQPNAFFTTGGALNGLVTEFTY